MNQPTSRPGFSLGAARSRRDFMVFAALLSMLLPATARVGKPPLSADESLQPLSTVRQLVLPPTDPVAELAADRKSTSVTPVRFAVARPVKATPATDGTWEKVPEGRVWRLRIISSGATDLNLGFSQFRLPEGATLHVSSETEKYFQGPYTLADNKTHGQLWTPLVPGDSAVVELFVPAKARSEPQLVLSQIGAGYRDMFQRRGQLPGRQSEGACNIDVVCPQAAGWSNEIRSVAVYTINGEFACSGTLISDVTADFRNYFLTANHCGLNGGNAPTVVVYWNFQSSSCGTHGPGSLSQNQSGATFRAARFDVDFALIELDEMPEFGFGVYYSGWDRSGMPPPGGVGIHHPDCDVKAISFSGTPLASVDSCISTGGSNTHWSVTWDSGVTEPGSSGSGIWDPTTHRLVGTLSGGTSSCFSPHAADCYGKFSVAWGSGGSATDRLQDWLDPQNIGILSVAGADPALVSLPRAAGVALVAESCSPGNGFADPGETVTMDFALKNVGGVTITNLVGTLLPDNGINSPGPPQAFGTLTGGGPAVSQSFTFTANGACGGIITPLLHLQSGTTDFGTVAFSITLGVPTPTLRLAENFDDVIAPSLPAGWSSEILGVGSSWAGSTDQSDTPPNSAFAENTDEVADNRLISPSISINTVNAQLTFRHSFNTEDGFDGGVLEISSNGGQFLDILAAGGTVVTNGYNDTLSAYYDNPLAERPAWTGDSGGFITTIINLPPGAPGRSIQLRWRFGSDDTYGVTGWYVDTIELFEIGSTCCSSLVPPVLLNPRIVSPGQFAFSYDSYVGQTYFVESTGGLHPTNWTILQTHVGDGSRQSYTNPASLMPAAYFRLRTQ
jgi:hypothetical protein